MDQRQDGRPTGLEQVPEERREHPSIEVSRASVSEYRSPLPQTVLEAPVMNGTREDNHEPSVNTLAGDDDTLSRSSSPGVAVRGSDSGTHRPESRPAVTIPRPEHYHYNHDYFALWEKPHSHEYHNYLRDSTPSGSSRSQSGNVSSSSLQGLDEPTSHPYQQTASNRPPAERNESVSSGTSTSTTIRLVRRPSSHTSHIRSGSQPLARISSNDEEDHPGYPVQSYEALHHQSFPRPYPRPTLRTRSSHPSQHSLYSDSAASTRQPRDHSTPALVSRTTSNTPASSPGLFSPQTSRSNVTEMDGDRYFGTSQRADHLEAPRDTSSLDKSVDMYTGNKMFNEYEVLKELGRGEHGKVKLARDLKRQKQVAIKIVQRFSKQRRLGNLGKAEEKVKKEVAILKKARHPNVVSLLEVIDDPKYKKVYIILEFVDLGEIVWRKQGIKAIVEVERRRLEHERKGLPETAESVEADQDFVRNAELRYQEFLQKRALQAKEDEDNVRELANRRARGPSVTSNLTDPRSWSLEHGGELDGGLDTSTMSHSTSGYETPHASANQARLQSTEELEQSPSSVSNLTQLTGSMYGPYSEPEYNNDRRAGLAPSMTSQLSNPLAPADEESSWVPCLTLSEIRSTFRDTVLGLEYLHYQGIIHRDLKPANLLWTADRRTKISDFGVSYLGRPIRDDDNNGAAEEEATEMHDPKELSRTVGTPAFYAPELCSIDVPDEPPQITGQIDVWALGVTLYCMLFGRVPFYDDNEWVMYQQICTDDLFIPRKRLKAVEDPAPTPPGSQAQLSRSMNSNKRLPFELVYEPVEEELVDLLKRLLTKDPSSRITLKEVKRHPWVLGEISDQTAWVEETDPSRQSAGKKIEVSDQDVAAAISKSTFIGRAVSNLKKLFPLGRNRAPSSATSVGTEPAASTSSSSTLGKGGEGKGSGLQGSEAIFNALKASREGEHPLSQSVTASPELKEGPSYFLASPVVNPHTASAGGTPAAAGPRSLRPDPPERAVSTAESTKTVKAPTSHLSSNLVPPNTPEPNPHVLDASSASTLGGLLGAGLGTSCRFARVMRSKERGNNSTDRSSSVDRSSVTDDDAHGEPSIAVSTAFASGQVNLPESLQEESPSPVSSERRSRFSSISTDSRSPQHPYDSTSEAFSRAQDQLIRRQVLEEEANKATSRPQSAASSQDECPPSPDDEIFYRQEQELHRRRQEAQEPPMEMSPPSAATMCSSSDDQFTSGMSQSASHPSIPSVVSGASSLSADDYLLLQDQAQIKGAPTSMVPPMMRTGDTVMPHTKSVAGRGDEDEAAWNGDNDDDDESEDEDEGLSFGPKTKKPIL